MSKKHFDGQLDDEDVLYIFRKHPIVMRKGLIIGMLCILAGTIPSLIKPEYSYLFGGLGAGLIVGFLFYLPSWISWYFSIFVVTDRRLIQITQKGLFNRTVVDMGLNQIQMVNYQVAGFQETLLGSGTIMMQTFVGDLIIHDVHHPAHIQNHILQILRDEGITANSYPVADLEPEIVGEELNEG